MEDVPRQFDSCTLAFADGARRAHFELGVEGSDEVGEAARGAEAERVVERRRHVGLAHQRGREVRVVMRGVSLGVFGGQVVDDLDLVACA